MLTVTNESIVFYADFIHQNTREPLTGLVGSGEITVDVYRQGPYEKIVADSADIVELGSSGTYSYTLGDSNTSTSSEYIAIFKTTNSLASRYQVPSIWSVGRAALDNLESLEADNIRSRLQEVFEGTGSGYTYNLSELTSIPDSTPSIAQVLSILYMAIRNRTIVTSNDKRLFNDADTLFGYQTISDDGDSFTQNKMIEPFGEE